MSTDILLLTLFCIQSALALTGNRPLPLPNMGLDGTATMHGDFASSDTTPFPGPGESDVNISNKVFLAACPTVLIRKSDGKPFVLSTSMLGRNPVVRLLNQRNGEEEAKLSLEAGSLLGGVYAFLDHQDRLVMVDGNQQLIRVKAKMKTFFLLTTWWELSIDESVSLLSAVTGHCGGGDCDSVVSISAGANDTLWFATQKSLVGLYDPHAPSAQQIAWLILGADERIDNSFSTTLDGRAAVVTDKALYVLVQDVANQPCVVWRQAYDKGSARKPGQLSHGSGATPTFFGPETGTDYVMITDNADERISLLVFDTEDGSLICSQPIFTAGVNSGTENSAIGMGRNIIIASTYGYPYPKLPEGAVPSVPENADFVGGMVRVDLNDCSGDPSCQPCHVVWENDVPSAAVPKLSTADERIYTVARNESNEYYFTVVDFDTGAIRKQTKIGSGFFSDTLQMAGNIGIEGVYWQGTISGISRIEPAFSGGICGLGIRH